MGFWATAVVARSRSTQEIIDLSMVGLL
jgi:hypothetical protein